MNRALPLASVAFSALELFSCGSRSLRRRGVKTSNDLTLSRLTSRCALFFRGEKEAPSVRLSAKVKEGRDIVEKDTSSTSFMKMLHAVTFFEVKEKSLIG